MKRFSVLLLGLLLLSTPLVGQDKKPKAGANPGKGYIPLTPEKRKMYQAISRAKHGHRIKMLARNSVLPSSFDARTSYPLPVWDQGSCGSCYLVATVRTATCALGTAGYGKPDNSFMLSAQFGMDSPRDFGGCNGGNGTEVIDWMIRNGWPAEIYIDSSGAVHNDYPPYEAQSGRDRTKVGAKKWMKDATWGFVSSGDGTPTVEEIKAALVHFGRLNIALDAGGQFGGIGTGTITRMGSSIDHEINCSGYDDNHNNGDGTKGAVLLENQWSTDWGNNGYAWCSYNAARNIVDWFFVSAGQLPPPPPSGAPYKLFEGTTTVGLIVGYPDLASAEADGQAIANKDKQPVMVHDKDNAMIETIQPQGPPPPTFSFVVKGYTIPGQTFSGRVGFRSFTFSTQSYTVPDQTVTVPIPVPPMGQTKEPARR